MITATAKPLYLILDQGGSQSRALVIDGCGRVITRTALPVATNRIGSDRVEQSAEEVVASLHNVASTAINSLDTASQQRLDSCGLACQRSSLLAWNSYEQKPLTAILSWQDHRGAALMPRDATQIESIRAATGLYPSAHHGASKCRWLRQHDDGVKRAAESGHLQFLPLASFLALRLFGQSGVDPANAQRTLLWSLHQQRWDAELLKQFDLDERLLPPTRPSIGDWGSLQVAGITLPCRLLAGDQSVAPLAYGEVNPDCAQVNLGTGGFICAPLPRQQLNLHRLLTSVAYSTRRETQYWLEGTVNGAGAALEWAASQPGYTDTGKQPALFLNAVGGLGSPYWRSDKTSRWLGSASHDRHRAVLESILFMVTDNLHQMTASGLGIRRLNLSGGVARVAGLAQQLADLTDLEVILQEEGEATALGAAWLLAGLPRHWQPCNSSIYSPLSAATPSRRRLGQRYHRWQRAMTCWLANSGAAR